MRNKLGKVRWILFFIKTRAYDNSVDPSQSQEIPVAEILTSVFFILVGFLFTFYGRHLFKSVLFLAGFLFGAAITFRILAAVEPVNDQGISQWGNDREWIYFGSQIAGGVLLGFLVVAVWRVGLFLLGLIGGFFISMALFSLFADAVNNDETFRLIFVIILSLVMGFLALFFEHPIVIISTAFAGSYSFFYGVDGFAQLGFQDAVNSFFGDPINNAPKITNGGVYGMIAGMIVLGIIGAVVQFKLTAKDARNYRDRDNSTLPFRSRKIQHDQSLV